VAGAAAVGVGAAAGAQAPKIIAAIIKTLKIDINRFVFISILSPSLVEVFKFALQHVGNFRNHRVLIRRF
jgi:hypothetical protein